jgi:CHAT domain
LQRFDALELQLQLSAGTEQSAPLEALRAWLPDLQELSQASGEDRDAWLNLLGRAEIALGKFDPEADLAERIEHFERGYQAAVEFSDVSQDPARMEEPVWARVSAAQFLIGIRRNALAVEWLDDARKGFPGATGTMPYLWIALAEAQRQLGRYQAALDAVEGGRALLSADAHALHAELAGVSGQILIEIGILDQAAREIATERRERAVLVEQAPPGAPDLAGIAADLRWLNLLGIRQEYDDAAAQAEHLLADVQRFPPGSSWRALLELQHARARACIALYRRELGPAALELLDQCSSRPELPERELLSLELTAAWLRMNLGDFEQAASLLGSADVRLKAWEADAARDAQEREPLPERAQHDALAARLDLLRGAEPEVLEGHRVQLETAFEGLCHQWEGLNPRSGGVGFLHLRLRRIVLSELVRLYVQLEGREKGAARALQVVLRAQSLGTLERRLDAPVGTLDVVRRELVLPKEHGILLYLTGPDQSHVFAIDGTTLGYGEFAGDRALHGLTEDFKSAWAGLRAVPPGSASTGTQLALARELARKLLSEEVRDQVASWKSLTVVGSELLGGMIFEALELREGEALGLSHALDYLPSIPLGLALARRPKPEAPELDLILVAAPSLCPAAHARWTELVPLELSAQTRQSLASSFPASRTVVLRPEKSTWEELSGLRPARARILCFLGHAVADAQRERPVGLVFAPSERHDGLVWCEQVESVGSPELVVLMACGSGRSPLRFADAAAASHDGAFLANGARVVVSTSSDVLLDPAVVLTRHLLANLAQPGTSPAAALRDARRQLASEGESAAAWMNATVHVSGLGQSALIAPARGPR